MTAFANYLLFLGFTVGVIDATFHHLFETTCGQYGKFKLCPNRCQPTCAGVERCSTGKKCGGGCECKSGYVLDSTGCCIPPEECPKTGTSKPTPETKVCDANSVYKFAPCVHSCAYMYLQHSCVPSSVSGCECLPGYFLNTKGQCVKDYDCTEKEVICPKNQTFSTCASNCELTCENVCQKSSDCDDFKCITRCDCNPGYVTNLLGQCILIEDCDPKEVTCPPKMKFDKCANIKQKTCENMYDVVLSKDRCVPDCVCENDMILNSKTGECIEAHDCENSLQSQACRSVDPNMKFYKSHAKISPTCNNPNQLSSDLVAGCFCKEGYILSNHRCIPNNSCPPPQ